MKNTDPKPTRRKDERPQEIEEAAMDVFSTSGFANAKIDDIAKKAGAAKGTVYLYFATKDDLFEAVVRRFVRPFVDHLDKMIDGFEGNTRDLLSQIILQGYQGLAGNPARRAILRILISEGHRFPKLTTLYHEVVICSAVNMMRRVIERGIEKGEFRDSPIKEFPQAIVGPIIMAAIWKMTFDKIEPLDMEKLSEAHLDMLFEGLTPR